MGGILPGGAPRARRRTSAKRPADGASVGASLGGPCRTALVRPPDMTYHGVMRYLACSLFLLPFAAFAACSAETREFPTGAGGGAPSSGTQSNGGGDGASNATGSGGANAGGGGEGAGCPGGRLDCDDNGSCETEGSTDIDNCGACGKSCFYGCSASLCTDPIQVSVGLVHACAVLGDGSVWCWGDNGDGQLGSPGGRSPSPRRVALAPKALAVAAGGDNDDSGLPTGFTCALLEDRTVVCWGAGDRGQLGSGTTNQGSPIAVPALSDVQQISAGGGHACAVQGDGKLFCWGDNLEGQIGNGNSGAAASVHTPYMVRDGMSAVAAGALHTLALTTNKDVFGWGDPSEGKLASSDFNPVTTPKQIFSLNNLDEIVAGGRHSCGRRSTTVYCWGSDYQGEVMQTFGTVLAPLEITNVPAATKVSVGQAATGAITEGGLTIWGATFFGHGMPSSGYDPLALDIGDAIDLSMGKGYTSTGTNCAIKATGELVCWGCDSDGQVGNGEPRVDELSPVSLTFTSQ
jgi:alpha-tubulin suppressor-like RCC1 family protein